MKGNKKSNVGNFKIILVKGLTNKVKRTEDDIDQRFKFSFFTGGRLKKVATTVNAENKIIIHKISL